MLLLADVYKGVWLKGNNSSCYHPVMLPLLRFTKRSHFCHVTNGHPLATGFYDDTLVRTFDAGARLWHLCVLEHISYSCGKWWQMKTSLNLLLDDPSVANSVGGSGCCLLQKEKSWASLFYFDDERDREVTITIHQCNWSNHLCWHTIITSGTLCHRWSSCVLQVNCVTIDQSERITRMAITRSFPCSGSVCCGKFVAQIETFASHIGDTTQGADICSSLFVTKTVTFVSHQNVCVTPCGVTTWHRVRLCGGSTRPPPLAACCRSSMTLGSRGLCTPGVSRVVGREGKPASNFHFPQIWILFHTPEVLLGCRGREREGEGWRGLHRPGKNKVENDFYFVSNANLLVVDIFPSFLEIDYWLSCTWLFKLIYIVSGNPILIVLQIKTFQCVFEERTTLTLSTQFNSDLATPALDTIPQTRSIAKKNQQLSGNTWSVIVV